MSAPKDTHAQSGGASTRASESRLLEIRREAESKGRVTSPPQGLSLPPNSVQTPGYYGVPVLKQPPWTWEIPAYLFVGGAAGAAAVIAGIGRVCDANPRLIRDAWRLAAAGGLVSPVLLTSDLGRPSRFLAMFRVFKARSPMSIGAWTLLFFSGPAAASAVLPELHRSGLPARLVGSVSHAAAALSGLALSTYTGVLLGATAIPVWAENAAILPVHFGASGLGSAVSLLELAGHELNPSLNALGIAAAITETAVGGLIEVRSKPALDPLKKGSSGHMARVGGLLSGPVPLLLRLLAGASTGKGSKTLLRVAAASTVAGSLLTRIAWVEAGKASARDPRVPLKLAVPPERTALGGKQQVATLLGGEGATPRSQEGP